MALLEVENLKVHYPVRGGLFHPKRFVRAVDGVTFSINAGETVGLVGESGCGKSTLGRALVRLEKPISGQVRLNGRDMSLLKGKELRRERKNFQMIFQDPYGSLNPRLTVFSALDEVLELHFNFSKAERRARAVELLDRVGLSSDALDRYAHEFSGGQRQRIGIARALAAEPALIVADEPVSALDVSVQSAIINLLEDIQNSTNTAFLFIAHDLAVVEHISARIIVMYLGKIVESAPARELVAKPLHPYTKILLSAVPTVERTKKKRIVPSGDVPSPLNPPLGCPFHPRCPIAKERCKVEAPIPVSVGENGRLCSCFYAF
ncbi:MAG: ATP-binding cassette domain-containing protein [Victivallales bacterium]|jgi:oligopeptide/dipeptide ABC transporter ATP-binding protein|nr:ATP-binding cassette domain-containing protein [Victivallales bacterium]